MAIALLVEVLGISPKTPLPLTDSPYTPTPLAEVPQTPASVLGAGPSDTDIPFTPY
jgi:hypothetical protein